MRDIYDKVKDHFRDNPDVVISEGKGAQTSVIPRADRAVLLGLQG